MCGGGGLLCSASSLLPALCNALIECVTSACLNAPKFALRSLGLHLTSRLQGTPACLMSWTLCLLFLLARQPERRCGRNLSELIP